MYGIDLVIPDVTYLIKNRARVRGLFITHGHEDHIGAIPYVLKQINLPIYCTRFTAGLIKLKLEEHGLIKSTKLITVEPGETVRVGKFNVEFIHVNHSIADSVAFAIHTHMGTVVHTGDFKIDSTPIDGEFMDLARLGALGKEGVLALCADSTNVERPGFTPSEKTVGATFMRQFTGCNERIIVTTFASNVHRIQQVLDAAAATERKVAVTGRSMKLWEGLGYYSRARNLQSAARTVATDLGGEFPDTYEGLLALPGVGDYTASAVASASFGRREPAVDGNVLRVFTRLTDCHGDIADPKTKKSIREQIEPIMPIEPEDIRVFNQAFMVLAIRRPSTSPAVKRRTFFSSRSISSLVLAMMR